MIHFEVRQVTSLLIALCYNENKAKNFEIAADEPVEAIIWYFMVTLAKRKNKIKQKTPKKSENFVSLRDE
jgi:hypothetical protein